MSGADLAARMAAATTLLGNFRRAEDAQDEALATAFRYAGRPVPEGLAAGRHLRAVPDQGGDAS
jgi:hypothetical protein